MPAATNQEYLEIIEQLRPIDDLFMRILFRNNKNLLEKVLNIVLNRKDIQIKRYEIQKDLKQVLSKSIICDIVIEDTKGNIYDIEVERNNARPERLRYYASVLDIEYLKKNMGYDECREIHVIFITEENYFKKGFPVYQVERTIKQLNNSSFNDRIYLSYVNGQYRGNDELGLLMYDFGCSDYREMKTIELREAVKQLKTGNVEERDMCEALEKFRDKAMAEGIAQGKAEGMAQGEAKGKQEEKEKTALKLQIKGMDIKDIAEVVECSISQVKEWLQKSNDCLV